MSFLNDFPHVRQYDGDLGWLIREIQRVDAKLDEYLENAVIKIADPILWDITSQYEQYTLVISGDGTAYLSRIPVPAGVSINNTDYWQVVFNYDDNINKIRAAIASVESGTVATVTRHAGDLVFVDGTLYEVTADIAVGSSYVVGTNITSTSVEDILSSYQASVDAQIAALTGMVAEALEFGTGSVYCDNVFCVEFNTSTHNNFWGGCVMGDYLYQYASDGDVSDGAGKILKIALSDGSIVTTVNQDLYWGNAITTDGTYLYALYGDTTTTMRVFKFDADLNYIGVVTVSMTIYAESLSWNGEELEMIAINRNANTAYVRTISSDLATVGSEIQHGYAEDADLHNSLICYDGGYAGITTTLPQRFVLLDSDFNLIRAMPFDGRAFNNAVSIGEVEGMCYSNGKFYINGQLSQTPAAFQDCTVLILHEARLDSAPASYKGLGQAYYNLNNFEVYCNIESGSVKGNGSSSAVFKSPIAANSACQYYSHLGWKVTLNFTAGQDLTDYILALSGLEGVQLYLRDYTLLGMHLYNCRGLEVNAGFTLSGERMVGTGYRGAQMDMYYCIDCHVNGTVTMYTGTNASVSLRCVHCYNNIFKSLTVDKGFSDDTGYAFRIMDGNIPAKLDALTFHPAAPATYSANDITAFIQTVINTVLGNIGNWMIPATWSGNYATMVMISATTSSRCIGFCIPQLENNSNKLYAFSYNGGNLRVTSFTGTTV